MRRRRPAVPAEHIPPPELLTFEESYWADLVDGDPVNAPEWASLLPEARSSAAIFQRWKAARARWREQHGWPCDPVDFILEERDERLRYVFGDNHWQARQARSPGR